MSALSGKTALVTGAAQGIGRAIAERLAQGGARVVIADRDEDAARAAAQQIKGGAIALPVDISAPASVATLFAVVEQLASRRSRHTGSSSLISRPHLSQRMVASVTDGLTVSLAASLLRRQPQDHLAVALALAPYRLQ
jgi:NAD(P)-dependent dehydrogenase (short-subunit alcohol dehydrogenase family)